MKLRILSAVLVFISAYSPLSVIFLIQDFKPQKPFVEHPWVAYSILLVSILSCVVMWVGVTFLKVSSPPVTIKSVSNRSGELVNYSIPYMISFFVMDLGDMRTMLSFGFFMVIMFWLTLKTHNIFINPILAAIGYNLYDIRYERDGHEREDFFLVKGERPNPQERVRIVELSEQLWLATERNPEV